MIRKTRQWVCSSLLLGGLLLASNLCAQGAGPNFSYAAETLGVSLTELTAAIGGPPPDFVGAAEKFGVSVEELLALLPAPPASDIPEGYSAEDFMQP